MREKTTESYREISGGVDDDAETNLKTNNSP